MKIFIIQVDSYIIPVNTYAVPVDSYALQLKAYNVWKMHMSCMYNTCKCMLSYM